MTGLLASVVRSKHAGSGSSTDRFVVRHTGLSDKTIAAVPRWSSAELPQSSTRAGADGRERPQEFAATCDLRANYAC